MRVGVVVLVHRVVGDNRHIPRFPLVADAIMHLKPFAVKDVKDGFIHVKVHLRASAGRVLFYMQVQRLSEAILRMDVVAGVCLRSIDESNFLRPAHARNRSEPAELIFEVVFTLNSAKKHSILALLEVLLCHAASHLADGV